MFVIVVVHLQCFWIAKRQRHTGAVCAKLEPAAVHVDQTHLSHDFTHNLHNTVDVQHCPNANTLLSKL